MSLLFALALSSDPAFATDPHAGAMNGAPPGHPDISTLDPGDCGPGGLAGVVEETMDAGGYTYVLIRPMGEEVWIAGPQTKVAVGDSIRTAEGILQKNFQSGSLKRSFDTIYFVQILEVEGDEAAIIDAAHGADAAAMASTAPLREIERLDRGQTVAEVYSKKSSLAGQQVALRGQVVKYTPGIMGKNWVHIQDGSGDASAGTHDLTFTTDSEVAVGDVVVVQGKLTTDRSFGPYSYVVLVEASEVRIEGAID